MRYLVFIDGQGDFDSDFTVLYVEAKSPIEAIEKCIAPEAGWGKHENGTAFVVPEVSVFSFTINDSRRRIASPTGIGEAFRVAGLKAEFHEIT